MQTVFRGTTLRSMLLEAYGFWMFGQIALFAAIASFTGAVLLLILSAIGLVHGRRVPAETEVLAKTAHATPADRLTSPRPDPAPLPSGGRIWPAAALGHRARTRSPSGWKHPACATPTSTPPAGTGPSPPPRRSCPATKGRHRVLHRRGVTSLQTGQRVAMPWLGYACGTCEHCLTGWETLCRKQQNTGYSVDGSFAEYFTADAAFAAPVPDGIDPIDAAPLTCAGVTTYKAVKVGNVRPADLATVFNLHRAGRTRVVTETRPLHDINNAIDDVQHGKTRARIVLQP